MFSKNGRTRERPQVPEYQATNVPAPPTNRGIDGARLHDCVGFVRVIKLLKMTNFPHWGFNQLAFGIYLR